MKVALYKIQNIYVCTSVRLCRNAEEFWGSVSGTPFNLLAQTHGTPEGVTCHRSFLTQDIIRGGTTINSARQTLGSSPTMTHHHHYQGLQLLPSFIGRSLPCPVTYSGVPRNFVRRGVQQIQLKTDDRENGDLGAVVL